MKRSINIICLCFLLSSSLPAQTSAELKWLEGSWKIETRKGAIVETWKVKNDSTLTGQSVFITGIDTVPQEKMELEYRNGSWYFHPILAGQSEINSTKFKVILIKGSEFICENPSHDFPLRISYRRIRDQMFANIEGKFEGIYQKENYDFIKN